MNAHKPRVTWRKSSYSFHNGECFEVAPHLPVDAVAIRDSKRPDGPVLLVSRAAFRALVRR